MGRRAGIRARAALLLALTGATACASPTIGFIPSPVHASTLPRQEVVVAADGGLSIAGKPTTLDRLPADLDAAFKAMGAEGDRADQIVMIVGDTTMTYEAFMRLLNVLSAAGWTRTATATIGR